MADQAAADPFRTDELRASVLASWAGSPTRFREDANAEEDLLLGGYADRWLVELAQNAADAAHRAGEPGRLLVRVAGGELRVANTGAALDRDGVAALASLRASSKRDDDTVGRFGVGFAAVLGVTGEPRIVSRTGGVAFSLSRTAGEVAALGGAAAEELRRRDGRAPVLRLCWPVGADEAPVPDGYDTEVRLPASDPYGLVDGAREAVPDLLLALPWLVEITVVGEDGVAVAHRRTDGPDGTVTLAPDGARWLLARRSGRVADALAGRAVEDRTDWSVCWAVPVDAEGRPRPLGEDVLHAPTPSDERLALPARLFASLPMQPSRRRVRTGPATDAVLAEAARAYLDLVLAVSPGRRAALAPVPGFPRSELDATLTAALTAELRDAAWLPAALPDATLAPRDAVLLDDSVPGLAEPLADVVPGLLAEEVAGAPRAALTALGVRAVSLGEVVGMLAGLDRPPEWWHRVYTALTPALDALPAAREELAALPVPLADGRTVTGPRTVIALTSELPLGDVELPGLRIAHPAAAHPLLHRLGATEAGPAELLDHPSVAEAVSRSVADAEDGADPLPLARFVLGLLAEIDPGTGAAPRPWLAALALPDADGEPCRADELMLPDAAIAPLLAPDAPLRVLAAELAAAWPRRVLTAVGVLDAFGLLVDEDPTGPDHDLDDEEAWWADTEPEPGSPRPPGPLLAVRDLDLVDDAAWPSALTLLAADPAYRRAITADHSYTAWWLARHARLAGHRPPHWRLASATALAGLFDPVPDGLDEELLAAIGVRRDASVRDTDDAAGLLARLGDPARSPDAALTWTAHASLAAAVLAGRVDPDGLDPPEWLRSVNGTVVDSGRAVLLDTPWLAPALPEAETVAGSFDPDDVDALAELLDLPLASEIVSGWLLDAGSGADGETAGDELSWTAFPEVVAACAAFGTDLPDGTVWRHDQLTVELTRPERRRVDVPVWRQDGRWHVVDPIRALVAARVDLTRLIPQNGSG
ncbi:sacsin N-terminal ATP-binding-like domain-containing protein [Pseudonocardia acaciae]|uniref:sacsin N-terminal ATP-binding-like domain-containing protein n=1 Tax=Pseudonocardia acaciae TaxID=551276 RepID=UPI0006852EB7|nr:hypothetical protein [Pseudonocardia acaciae]